MDVQLYVYDLSQGLARQMSLPFLGIQIDAVYHTSLVFGGIEYFFGQGVQTCYPGTTHHGQPMEKISLGRTELPLEVILEYLETLKETYTAESYDLFAHNCNNFTHDFATFIVGRGIPPHITSLPETVLRTPFGQMLRPQLDRAMRTVTQAPVASPSAVNVQANVVRDAVVSAAAGSNGSTINPASSASVSAKAQQSKPQPKHPHTTLPLRAFRSLPTTPLTHTSIPPLAKLTAKMGPLGTSPAVASAVAFLTQRQTSGAAESPIPDDLPAIGTFLRESTSTLPLEVLFTSYDLLRLLLIDARISGYFAEEPSLLTLSTLLGHVLAITADDTGAAPAEGSEKLRLVATQMCCNLFTSPLMVSSLFGSERCPGMLVQLAARGVMDANTSVKTAAARLAVNIATSTNATVMSSSTSPAAPHILHTPARIEQEVAIDLAASIIEAIQSESNAENTRNLAVALGRLVYAKSDEEAGELVDMCAAMDVGTVVGEKASMAGLEGRDQEVVREVGEVLFVDGL